MKKILYSFMLLFAATLCFTACSDDDDNGSIQMPADPAANVAGTYVGTWTSTNQTSGAVTTSDGVVTLTKDSTAYTATLSIEARSAISLSAMSSAVNISWNSGNVYNFFNKTTTNELGTAFAGKVYDETTMDFTFTKTVRSGRKTTTFTFTFNGTKQ